MSTTTETVAAQFRRNVDYRDLVSDELAKVLTDERYMLAGNSWEGVDAHLGSRGGECLRVTPIDGEWEAGFEVYHLSANRVMLTSMTVQAGHYSPAFVARCAANLLTAEDGGEV